MKGPVAGALAATLAGPIGLAAALMGAVAQAGGTATPSLTALSEIPPPLLAAYQRAAATCPGLRWEVLAAVGKVESGHGTSGGTTLASDGTVNPPIIGPALDGSDGVAFVDDTDHGRWDGDPSLDHAVGPMQFLPGTWSRWGRDGNGDGTADPHNAFDAVFTAAAYLCGGDGRIDDLTAALLSYNNSAAYVDEVFATAATYGSGVLLGADLAALLANPNLSITDAARADLLSGRTDARVVAVLAAASSQFPIGVGVIRTGHAQCVGGGSIATDPGCSISNHWYGRAVDIVAVGGNAVSPGNGGARHLAEWLVSLPTPLRPDELGVPWAAMEPIAGVFADSDHQTHLHVGFEIPLPGT